MVGHRNCTSRYLWIVLVHVVFVLPSATSPVEAFHVARHDSQFRQWSKVTRSRFVVVLARRNNLYHDSAIYSLHNTTATATTASDKTKQSIERRIAKRWNGNYKHSSSKLCDVAKAKKLQLALTVQHADGQTTTKTLVKKRQETLQHVLTKAVLWKLFCDQYPNIEIEHDIGDPDYLPDVISLDSRDGNPLFWGESGRMKVHKAVDLMRRYPNCHIVHCRWDMGIDEISAPLLEHLQELVDNDCIGDLPTRAGQFAFCSIPLDVWRFIDEETGVIHVTAEDISWLRLEFPTKSIG